MSKSNEVSIFDIEKQKELIIERNKQERYRSKTNLTKVKKYIFRYFSIRSDTEFYQISFRGIVCKKLTTLEIAQKILQSIINSVPQRDLKKNEDGILFSTIVKSRNKIESRIQKIVYENKREEYVLRISINRKHLNKTYKTLKEAQEAKKIILEKKMMLQKINSNQRSYGYDAVYYRDVLQISRPSSHIEKRTNNNTGHTSFTTVFAKNSRNRHLGKLNKAFATLEEAIVHRDYIKSQYVPGTRKTKESK